MKNYNIFSLKNPTFKGGVHEKPIQRERLPKKGGLDFGLLADLREGGLTRKRGMVFLRMGVGGGGVEIPMHTM